MLPSRILFCLTGSIACFKACSVVSKLVQSSYEVQCIATHSALEFIGKRTLEGLTDKRVITDKFDDEFFKVHIDLVNWADLVIVCPATANSINRLALGLADDIVGLVYLANNFQKPFLIAPAMNTQMLNHPTVVDSINKLTQEGAIVLSTKEGTLACGSVGLGKLEDVGTIFEAICKHLNK